MKQTLILLVENNKLNFVFKPIILALMVQLVALFQLIVENKFIINIIININMFACNLIHFNIIELVEKKELKIAYNNSNIFLYLVHQIIVFLIINAIIFKQPYQIIFSKVKLIFNVYVLLITVLSISNVLY